MQSLTYCLDITERDSHTVKPLYALNSCFWRLFHWFIWYVFCKKNAPLWSIFSVNCSARWQTNFNFNHTPNAGTLPSTGRCWPTAQLLLCLPCAPEEETFCLLSKSHTDHAAIRKWPIKLNQQIFKANNRLVEYCWE